MTHKEKTRKCSSCESKCSCECEKGSCECKKGSCECNECCGECEDNEEESCRCSCHEGSPCASIKTIGAEALREKMAMNKNLKVINVLAKEYFDDCHIKDSINVPLNILKQQATGWDKNTEIVVYCAHEQCSASHEAYKLLCSMGFEKLYAYEGGMKDWKDRGMPGVGPCELTYLK